MAQTENTEVKKLTIKTLLSKLSEDSKNALKEYCTIGLWNEGIEEIRTTGFFISLGVASKNEGMDGIGLSQEVKNAVLAQLN